MRRVSLTPHPILTEDQQTYLEYGPEEDEHGSHRRCLTNELDLMVLVVKRKGTEAQKSKNEMKFMARKVTCITSSGLFGLI